MAIITINNRAINLDANEIPNLDANKITMLLKNVTLNNVSYFLENMYNKLGKKYVR